MLLDAVAVWDHFRHGASGARDNARDSGSASSPVAGRFDRDIDEGGPGASGSLPTIGERGDRSRDPPGARRERSDRSSGTSDTAANPTAATNSRSDHGQGPGLRRGPSKGAVAVLHRVAELMSSRRELLGSGSGHNRDHDANVGYA